MSLVPTPEDMAFAEGRQQASDDYNVHIKRLHAEIESLRSELASAREALTVMLEEHDIMSGNFGADVMDPKHARPDRWPHAAALARAVIHTQEGSK